MTQYLYSRDSKDKVRVLVIEKVFIDEDHYEIRKQSGLLNGKLTDAPVKVIKKGKQKRTVEEQCDLELNSIINKKKDEGYKSLELLTLELEDKDIDPMSYPIIDELLPKGKTYANSFRKLMLAKDPKGVSKYYNADKSINPKGWNRDWWVSKKLDGIRAGVTLVHDNLESISRKGKSMNVAFTKIFEEPILKSLCKKLGVMIDGEIYKHGKSLQSLAGCCQLKEYTPDRHDILEFWIFDYADDTKTAEERATTLNALAAKIPEGSRIRINAQVKASKYETIKTLHDTYVKQGFEGAICRAADEVYGFGKRDDRMIKIKEFDDAEFEIIDYKLGARGAEDMCFIMKMDNGKTFESKPIGPKELKIQYVADIENLIGKMATVKFFGYTEDGIPFINCTKAIRDYE